MKIFVLSICVLWASAALAQKHYKKAKVGKGAFLAPSPGPQHAPSYGGSSHHGGGHYASPNAIGGAEKAVFPALISDTRSLNYDGSINYNFAADNGLKQGETVDTDGTRRGFYSYPGADGKLITVKYTAGKNGFIAEGDHLPRQPQIAAHTDKDEVYAPKTSGYRGGSNHGPPKGGFGGGYHASPGPSHYPAPSAAPHYSGSPQQYNAGKSSGSGHYGAGAGPEYDHGPPASVTYGGSIQGGGHGYGSASPYSSSQGNHLGSGHGRGNSYANFGGPSFGGSFSHAPNHGGSAKLSHHGSRPASYNPQGGSYQGSSYPQAQAPHIPGAFSVANPYVPQGASAGPYNAKFNLGNGGHFAINFSPGQSQSYDPAQGYGGGSLGSPSHGHGQQGVGHQRY